MGYIRELLWPRRCPVCGEVAPWGEWICPECRNRLPRVKEPRCKRCGLPIAEAEEEYCENCRERDRSFDDGVVGFRYNSPVVRNLILQAKDRNLRQYYDYPCALMAEIYRERIRRFLPECLIPVPLYPVKRRKRGFNQSEEIARRLSEAWGIPMRPEILRRIRATRDQKTLGTAGRAANVAGAFAVPPGVRVPLRAALVDDVITTGATMDACALALKKAGCRAVISVALTGSGGNLLES